MAGVVLVVLVEEEDRAAAEEEVLQEGVVEHGDGVSRGSAG